MYRMRTATPQKNLCQWARNNFSYISFCCITADEHARKQYVLRHRIDHVHMVVVTVSGGMLLSLHGEENLKQKCFFLRQRVLDAVM